MVEDCTAYVDSTLRRLRKGFEVVPENSGCRVIAPLLRRDGDPLEVVVLPQEDRFVVSDDGDTIDYLQLSGVNTRRNRAFDRLLSEVRSAHEVSVDRGAISSEASELATVGDAIVRVLAAMSDLSQMELARREMPPRTFDALVEGELVGQGLPYEPRVNYRGAIRERTFRFGINSSRKVVVEPMRAQTSSRAVELAAVLIVSVEDVWNVDPGVAAIAVLDDRRDVWSERALPDLAGRGLNVVRWSERHNQFGPAVESPRRAPGRP